MFPTEEPDRCGGCCRSSDMRTPYSLVKSRTGLYTLSIKLTGQESIKRVYRTSDSNHKTGHVLPANKLLIADTYTSTFDVFILNVSLC